MFRSRKLSLHLHRFLLFSMLIGLFGNLLLPQPALAWKPTSHVLLGEIARLDALDNGKVTIHRVNYKTGQVLGVLGEYGEFTFNPPNNALKHILLEGYLDKRMDQRAVTAATFNVSIDIGVDGFIYRYLIDARDGTDLAKTLLRRGAPDTEFSIPRIYSSLRDDLVKKSEAYRKAARPVRGTTRPAPPLFST